MRIMVFALVAAVLVFASCEQPEPTPTVGECTLNMTMEKSLVSTVNANVAEYVYKATPTFDGATSGTNDKEWNHLSYGGPGTIGLLTQGKWNFSVEGRNSKGATVTKGSTTAYIEAGQDNIIEVQMHTAENVGTGDISWAVWTQKISEKGTHLKVYDRARGEKVWTFLGEHKDDTTENPRFSGGAKGLKTGYHDLLFMLYDLNNNSTLGGEQIGIQVVAGSTTAVSGIIEPAYETSMDLSIKSMGKIHATLNPEEGPTVQQTTPEEGERGYTTFIERGDTITFTWQDKPDATSIPTEYIWALDGEIVPENIGKSFDVCWDKFGEHELSVVGIRRDEDGVAWDAGSAVMRIIVIRHICEITFDAGLGFFSDGQNVTIIKEDTTDVADRKIPGGQPYDGFSPQRSGFKLIGWKDEVTNERVVSIADDGKVTFLDGFATKKDTRTLVAEWVAGDYDMNVIWGENVRIDGTVQPYMKSYHITCGNPMTMLVDTPERSGFEFLGYTTEENGRGEKVTNKTPYEWGKTITIYANWKYNDIHVSYFKAWSDYEKYLSDPVKYPAYKRTIVGSDLRYGSLPQPLRQGKVFKGWAQPEDIDSTQKARDPEDGKVYLTKNALVEGRQFVEIESFVKKYEDHPLVAVWGEGDIKITLDYGNPAEVVLTKEGMDDLAEFETDSNGNYFINGALGTQYHRLPFSGIETKVRDGWEFMGWYDSPKYSLQVYEESAVTTMTDHTLYGKWSGKKLEVSFDDQIGGFYKNITVRYGGRYMDLPIPSRNGYDFIGWYVGNTLINEGDVVRIKDSHTLVAHWKPQISEIQLNLNAPDAKYDWSKEMKVEYDAYYSEAVTAEGDKFGDENGLNKLKSPTRFGYDFRGWYNNPAGAGNPIKSTTVNHLYEPQSFYAMWQAHKHCLIYNYQWPGGKAPAGNWQTKSDLITFGSSYGSMPNLDKTVEGYTFNGWFDAPVGGKRVSETDRLKADNDVPVYAHWSVMILNISFYEDGNVCVDESGKPLEVIKRTWGTKFGQLPVPAKKGYEFTGKWQLTGNDKVQITPESLVKFSEDITLSPIWRPMSILVAVAYDMTVSDGGIISYIDWMDGVLRACPYTKSMNEMMKVLIENGKWRSGDKNWTDSEPRLPSYTKTGHYQDLWKLVIPGEGVMKKDSTAILFDYGSMDEHFIRKYGDLKPNDRMVYLVPNWTPNKYTVTFEPLLYDEKAADKISPAFGAPERKSVIGSYEQELCDLLMSEDYNDWSPEWNGYVCMGYYYDPELTIPVDVHDKFGQTVRRMNVDGEMKDVYPLGEPNANNGFVTIYMKWKKVRIQYLFDTNSLTTPMYEKVDRNIVYPLTGTKSGEPYSLFPMTATRIFPRYEGLSDAPADDTKATKWVNFEGKVDDLTWGSGTLARISNNGDAGVILDFKAGAEECYKVDEGESVYPVTQFEAPADMDIDISLYEPPYFDYWLKCAKCGGQGGSKQFITSSIISEESGYEDKKTHQFEPGVEPGKTPSDQAKFEEQYQPCIHDQRYGGVKYSCSDNAGGCDAWPSNTMDKVWKNGKLTTLNNPDEAWVTCTHEGNGGRPVTWTREVQTRTASEETEVEIIGDDGKPVLDEHGNPKTETKNVMVSYKVIVHTEQFCWCQHPDNVDVKGYRRKGQIRHSAGYSNLGREYGDLDIYVRPKGKGEFIKVDFNGSGERQAYMICKHPNMPYQKFWFDTCSNPPQYTLTGHYDSYWNADPAGWITYGDSTCTNCEGRRAVLRNSPDKYHPSSSAYTNMVHVNRGDIVKIVMKLPAYRTSPETEYIYVEPHGGHLILKDVPEQYSKVTLIGGSDHEGKILRLYYDSYDRRRDGSYMTVGTRDDNLVISEMPDERYYAYSGFIKKNSWGQEGIPRDDEKPVLSINEPIGEIEYAMLDHTRPNIVHYVLEDGTTFDGVIDENSYIRWNPTFIEMKYKNNNGGYTEYKYKGRLLGESIEHPVKEMKISCWLKDVD